MGGKAWSAAEIDVLHDLRDRALTLKSQMHRLPGRSYDSAKSYACKVGIKLGGAEPWTDMEKTVLAEIWRGRQSIKLGMQRLPGRTYQEARAAANRMGLRGAHGTKGRTGYAWVSPAVAAVLADRPNLSVARIAEITGAGVNSVNRALRAAHGSKFRISGWARSSAFGGLAALWAVGTEADAAKPGVKPMRLVQKDSNARARIRAGRFDPFANLIQQVAA